MPTDFDLPYRDLPLETPDGVKLRCYLLTQRKELPNIGAMPIESPDEESNEEVRFSPPDFHSSLRPFLVHLLPPLLAHASFLFSYPSLSYRRY